MIAPPAADTATEMKPAQNIYDNPDFFAGYRALRKRDDNYNILVEQPAMTSRLPDLNGKCVLDLGCGFGTDSAEFLRRGAVRVTGVDISENMLEAARHENAFDCVEYVKLDLSELERLPGKFDFVYSSLAFHYVPDLNKLMRDIAAHLTVGGTLLFSQEHPMNTDVTGHFNKDENGKAVSFTCSGYCKSGLQSVNWIIDGVEKYHRTFSEIINAVAFAGLTLREVCEPMPDAHALEIRPDMYKNFIKPVFLVVRAEKV